MNLYLIYNKRVRTLCHLEHLGPNQFYFGLLFLLFFQDIMSIYDLFLHIEFSFLCKLSYYFIVI